MATSLQKSPLVRVALVVAGMLGLAVGLSIVFPRNPPHPQDAVADSRPRATKAQVLARLKDPDSAEFRDTHRGADTGTGVPLCGEVNAKNGFGGYVGYKRFIAWPEGDVDFEDHESSVFKVMWVSNC
ncbi:hypothetical protein CJO91_13065 [Ralstonia solanacearum]|uniref:hypothetical protein n=1 Tax=Ralstonia pseudosolanacearum TaxID=1310165 RepID=UPI000E57FA56|nr:hypothetical protein [Ralstonia pseudosolanacearum]AXW48540.1 hypothetical protein CJO91_13065 [Ralstonia solanacearum]MCK4148998.1 hypothetical protein [Ralstonia pseudosolanacearum]NKF74094.1 hypothetical protein [Ralstonia solanacearum]BCL86256.1 hypothetical protein MAFF211471_13390 [Ralstonia solanacearum]BCM98805.1 hypothetical protein RPSA_13420 [Ralstonia solanacearum]